jgi:hypothetical protein
MLLKPEKHLEMAAAFQALADDPTQPEAVRAEFPRKAKLWRWLAGRAEMKLRFGRLPFVANAPPLANNRARY